MSFSVLAPVPPNIAVNILGARMETSVVLSFPTQTEIHMAIPIMYQLRATKHRTAS